MRWLAFGLFAAAAFDLPMPWLDRVGAAALGLGFVALTVGRAAIAARPSTFSRVRALVAEPMPQVGAVTRETDELLTRYLAGEDTERVPG